MPTIINPSYLSQYAQIQKNKEDIAFLKTQVKAIYKTSDTTLTEESTSVLLNTTNITDTTNIANCLLINPNGLLYQIMGVVENTVNIVFYANVKGIQGDTGAQGPQGPAGPAGQQGAQGEPAMLYTKIYQNISAQPGAIITELDFDDFSETPEVNDIFTIIIDVSVVPQETYLCTATINLIGEHNVQAQIIDSVKINGEAGAQGETGPQGPQGPTGPQGEQGLEALTTSFVSRMTSDPAKGQNLNIPQRFFNRTPIVNDDLIMLWVNINTKQAFMTTCKIINISTNINLEIDDYFPISIDLNELQSSITNINFTPSSTGVTYENETATVPGTFILSGGAITTPQTINGSVKIPIVAGEGIVIDANETTSAIEVHSDGGSNLYLHNLVITFSNSDTNERGICTLIIKSNSNNLITTLNDLKNVITNNYVISSQNTFMASGYYIKNENPSYIYGLRFRQVSATLIIDTFGIDLSDRIFNLTNATQIEFNDVVSK